jgi:hypothetical protein
VSISTSPVQQATAAYSSGTSLVISHSAFVSGNHGLLLESFGNTAFNITSVSTTNIGWGGAADESHKVGRGVEIWSAKATGASGTSTTVNFSGSGLLGAASLSEWSGLDPTTWLDVHGGNDANPSGNFDTPSLTPTAGREALFFFGGRLGNAYISGPTVLGSAVNTGPSRLTQADTRTEIGYAIATSTSGAYQFRVVETSGAWSCAMAVYLAPSGGGTTFTDSRTESLTAVETETATAGFSVARVESLTAAETEAATLDAVVARAESLTAADSSTAALTAIGAATESLTATESETAALTASTARTESLTAADSQDATVVVAGVSSASESVTVAATQSATVTYAVALAETLSAVDVSVSPIISVDNTAVGVARDRSPVISILDRSAVVRVKDRTASISVRDRSADVAIYPADPSIRIKNREPSL